MNLKTMRANIRDAAERIAPPYLLRSYYFARMRRGLQRARAGPRRFEAELALLPVLLSDIEGGSAIDVGANIGDYTLLIAKLFGAARTYACEPQAALYRRLERLFPKAHLFRVAVSDCVGEVTLKIPTVEGLPLRSRATLEQFSEIGETGATFETVPVETLDRLADRAGISDVRFIKIDVEGHEHKVIAGASRILAASQPVLQVEIEQRHHVHPIEEIFKAIESHGYVGYYFNPLERRLVATSEFSVRENQDVTRIGWPGYVNNFLFLGRSSAEAAIDKVHRRMKASANDTHTVDPQPAIGVYAAED